MAVAMESCRCDFSTRRHLTERNIEDSLVDLRLAIDRARTWLPQSFISSTDEQTAAIVDRVDRAAELVERLWDSDPVGAIEACQDAMAALRRAKQLYEKKCNHVRNVARKLVRKANRASQQLVRDLVFWSLEIASRKETSHGPI
jgi:hypothetical protein